MTHTGDVGTEIAPEVADDPLSRRPSEFLARTEDAAPRAPLHIPQMR